MIIPNQSNITFSYTLPDGLAERDSQESNIVNTEILTYSVPKVKSSNKTSVQQGGIAHHTVTVTNNSATQLFNNTFTDQMSAGASYVAGSVKVNGVAQPSYDPLAGFALPNLNPGESATIEYDIKADNPSTNTPVTNFATINYTIDDPARGNVNYSENTNTVSLDVFANKLTVEKVVDKAFAIKGDILHYVTTVGNMGDLDNTDIVFKDPIPVGTTFVAGSVKINGTSYPAYNPEVGFDLPDLEVAAFVIVEFDAKVN